MVAFNAIPLDVRTPGAFIEFDNSRAIQGLVGQPHRVLLLGQQLSGGTQPELTPVQVLSSSQGESLFGLNSQLSQMITAYKANDSLSEVWAMGMNDDGAAVKATYSVEVTGTPTANGVIALYIGGVRVAVPVTSGAAVNDIAADINTAVNDTTRIAAVASVATNVVTLTAIHGGTIGNEIDVRTNYRADDSDVPGVTIAIAAVIVGATDPDITGAVAALGAVQYHTLITGLTSATAMSALEAEFEDRWGPMVQLEGHVFGAIAGDHSTLSAAGAARNSAFSTLLGINESPTLPWEAGAAVGAQDAKQTQVDPARPRQTLALRSVLPAVEADRFTRAERDLLLKGGIATVVVDMDGTVRIERLITTFQTQGGVPNTSYLDVTTMRTLAFLRFSTRAMIASKYPRHKLADDGTAFAPGQAIVTPSILRGEMLVLFRLWEANGLVEGFEQFKEELLIVRSDTDPNRIDAVLPPDLINQFRVFAGQIQFLL